MNRSYAVVTLGCRANHADTDTIKERFTRLGFKPANAYTDADVCVVNTCTVTANADSESRQVIRKIKRENPSAKIIVCGCYANMSPDELRAMPETDAVWVSQRESVVADREQLHADMTDFLKSHFEEWSEDLYIQSSWNHSEEKGDEAADPQTLTYSGLGIDRVRPFVKIQNGCNLACTYCIVPQARGKSRSLYPDLIIDEIRRLASLGYHEAVITGIHIGHYGWDLSPKTSLTELLKQIDREKPIAQVRVSSVDPNEVTDEMIDVIAKSDVICHHFHIPYQSGSSAVLKRMKRAYGPEMFTDLVTTLHHRMPYCGIGTDIIVGFPGETDEEFEATYQQMSQLPMSYLHVFPYSDRAGTRAAEMEDKVDGAVKRARVTRLIALSKAKREAFYQTQLGMTTDVILETKRDFETGWLKGVTEHYTPVVVDGPDDWMRHTMRVRLVRIEKGRLVGERI